MPITRPSRSQVHVFPDATALRGWLEANHDTATEAWFGYYQRDSGKTSVTYPEAVDQALCFGWIDGITYRIDDEVTANRFTPRRRGSNWSAVNIAKVGRLKADGLMMPAGLRAFEDRGASTAARNSSARQEATRERRLAQLIADSAAGAQVKPLRSDRPPASGERAR